MSEFGRSYRETSDSPEHRRRVQDRVVDDGWDDPIDIPTPIFEGGVKHRTGQSLDAPYRDAKGNSRFEPNDITLAFKEPPYVLAYRNASADEQKRMTEELRGTLGQVSSSVESPRVQSLLDGVSHRLNGVNGYIDASQMLGEGVDNFATHYGDLDRSARSYPSDVVDIGLIMSQFSTFSLSPSATKSASKFWLERGLGTAERIGQHKVADRARNELNKLSNAGLSTIKPGRDEASRTL